MKYIGSVPRAVQVSIAEFEVPSHLSQFTVIEPCGKATDSIGFSYGVFVENPVGDKYFICKASEYCRDQTRDLDLSKTGPKFGLFRAPSTSPVSRHLQDVHGVRGVKSLLEEENKAKFDKVAGRLINSQLFKEDKARCGDLLTSALVIVRNLPYKFVEYSEYRLFLRVMVPDGNPCLSTKKLLHHQTEMYCFVTDSVIALLENNDVSIVFDMGTVSYVSMCSYFY